MILDVGEVIEELLCYLSMCYPSVQWQVTHGQDPLTPEPIIHIAARRHAFQPLESMVQCSFRLWESMDPMTGAVQAAVWSRWAMKTLDVLQHA